jgi:MerR family transcriptional regulator, copper efflux regulator
MLALTDEGSDAMARKVKTRIAQADSRADRNSTVTHFTIGQAAAASGVSAKMIRHYEDLGMIPRSNRTPSNYRAYSDADVQTLRLVRRSRDLGFSMQQIATLVSLWRNRGRSSATVRGLALEHIDQLQEKIEQLQSMVRTLQQLADTCHGDARPECPILDDLAKPASRKAGREQASRGSL